MHFIDKIFNSRLLASQKANPIGFQVKQPPDAEQKVRAFLIDEIKNSNLGEEEKAARIKLYNSPDFPLSLEDVTKLSEKVFARHDAFAGLFSTSQAGKKQTTFKRYLAYNSGKEKVRDEIVNTLISELYWDPVKSGRGHLNREEVVRMATPGYVPSGHIKSKADTVTDLSFILRPKDIYKILDFVSKYMKAEIPSQIVDDILRSKREISISELLANI